MLRIYFSLCFLFALVLQTNAQISFPTENASWCYQKYGDVGQDLGSMCIQPLENVVLNNKSYTKVDYRKAPDGGSTETIYYRSEDRRFYVLPQDSLNEILIYDFNLIEGDTFHATWGLGITDTINMAVSSVEWVTTLDGVERKKLILEGAEGYGAWLEGIGSLYWLFVYPAYINSLSGNFTFRCHSENGNAIYPDWATDENCDFVDSVNEQLKNISIKTYPNPSNGIVTVTLENLTADLIQLIDVNGEVAYHKEINPLDKEIVIDNKLSKGVFMLLLKKNNIIVGTERLLIY